MVIQNLFNLPYVDYEAGLEFLRNEFNRENLMRLSILCIEVLDVLGEINLDVWRMKGLTSLSYSDADKSYRKQVPGAMPT